MLKLAPGTGKNETPPIYENCCSFDQKRNCCPLKASTIPLKSYESSNFLLWKILLEKSSSTTATRFFQRNQILVIFLTNTNRRSDFSAQPQREKFFNFGWNWITFPFAGNDVQLQENLSLSWWSYKDCISFYFASGGWFYIKLWAKFQKSVSADDNVHFIDEENIVTYVDFDCGITFYPETPTKNRQINRERNYISGSCEKPKCIPSNDQTNSSIDKQHTSNNFLNPYILWDMVPAALMSLHHTNDRISISKQYPQPPIHQPRTDSYPVFSSLRTMDSKRKGLHVSFAVFQRKSLLDGRVNETVATFEELSDLWKLGAMDGIPPFVMNCECI